MSVYFIHF